MSFSKVIQIGSIGQFSLNEDKGVASVKVEVSHGLAGEAVKGVASAEIDVSAVELAQLALDFIKSKLPSEAQALVSALEAVAIPALKNL